MKMRINYFSIKIFTDAFEIMKFNVRNLGLCLEDFGCELYKLEKFSEIIFFPFIISEPSYTFDTQ